MDEKMLTNQPQDAPMIRTFKRSLWGYSSDEVNEQLRRFEDVCNELRREKRELEHRLRRAEYNCEDLQMQLDIYKEIRQVRSEPGEKAAGGKKDRVSGIE